MFRHLVLGLLQSAGPLYGYALMKECLRRSGLRFSTGNFYRELARLAREGLVRQVSNAPGADPRRTPYAISDEGRRVFARWLCSHGSPDVGRYDDELSARVLFLGGADAGLRARTIEQWREELWVERRRLERVRQSVAGTAEGGGSWRDPLALLIERRLQHLAADAGFVDALASALADAGRVEVASERGIARSRDRGASARMAPHGRARPQPKRRAARR